MMIVNETYEKMKDLFGDKLTNDLFPETAIGETLIGMSAILQTICNILILKGVITKEEYLKWFSEEELKKIANEIIKQAKEN